MCDLKYVPRSAVVHNVLVDAEVALTWIDGRTLRRLSISHMQGRDRTFRMPDGRELTRQIGYAMLRADPNFQTVDVVVFAEPDDVQMLGARTLLGFNAAVDPANKHLIAGGPQVVPANFQMNSEI